MSLPRRTFLGAGLLLGAGLAAPAALAAPRLAAQPKLGDRPPLLPKALAALDRHAGRIAYRDRIAIADYSAHSRELRFHFVDLGNGRISESLLVSHGRGSDLSNSGFVQRFSNRPGSNASSEGSFLTGQAYVGKHGRSRRLHGLDPENDLAFDRAIVVHGADYVDRRMAATQGRVGRSLGCFAFERSQIDAVLARLGEGRLLYAGQ